MKGCKPNRYLFFYTAVNVFFFRRKDSLYNCIEEKKVTLTALPLNYSTKSRKSSHLLQSEALQILKTKQFRKLDLDKVQPSMKNYDQISRLFRKTRFRIMIRIRKHH